MNKSCSQARSSKTSFCCHWKGLCSLNKVLVQLQQKLVLKVLVANTGPQWREDMSGCAEQALARSTSWKGSVRADEQFLDQGPCHDCSGLCWPTQQVLVQLHQAAAVTALLHEEVVVVVTRLFCRLLGRCCLLHDSQLPLDKSHACKQTSC